jgi:hypothetical protein
VEDAFETETARNRLQPDAGAAFTKKEVRACCPDLSGDYIVDQVPFLY